MRLDYALYGLAVVLFAFAAFAFAYVADVDAGIIYAVVTTIIGLFSVVGGYTLRPKVDGSYLMQTSTLRQVDESFQQTLEPVVAEAPVAEESKPKSPSIDTSSQGSTVENAQKVENVDVTAPTLGQAEVPVASMQEPTVEAQNSATAPEKVLSSEVSSPVEKLILTQIRGINEKRVEQLKANGIATTADLAEADPDDLAKKLDVSVKIVKMWIGSAKKITK